MAIQLDTTENFGNVITLRQKYSHRPEVIWERLVTPKSNDMELR